MKINEDTDLFNEIVENERWLARFDDPSLSDETLSRIKGAIRSELADAHATTTRVSWWARPWHGAVAAAAMLAISVGVVQYATSLDYGSNQPRLALVSSDSDDVQPITEWKSLPTTIELDDSGLEELSEWELGDSWALSGASMYEAFEEAFDDEDGAAVEEQGAMAPAQMSQLRSI